MIFYYITSGDHYMKYYTVTEASKFFNVSRVTIFRWIKEGKIDAMQEKDGREEYKIPESQIPEEKIKASQDEIAKGKHFDSSKVTLPVTNISPSLSREILDELKHISQVQERIATALERLTPIMEGQKLLGHLVEERSKDTILQEEPKAKLTKPLSTPSQKKSEVKTTKQSKEASIDWEDLRKKVQEEANRLGGNTALARKIGVDESLIRRFVKDKKKTVSSETLNKLRNILNETK